LAFKYDVKVVNALLMVFFYQLNPTTNASIVIAVDLAKPNLEKKMFGVESFQALITKELFLFKEIFIPSFTSVVPLAWLCIHES
jgi:hypothetical protein